MAFLKPRPMAGSIQKQRDTPKKTGLFQGRLNSLWLFQDRQNEVFQQGRLKKAVFLCFWPVFWEFSAFSAVKRPKKAV